MNNKIRHSGIIDSIENSTVRVRILQTSACAACKVAAHCNASESKEKLVDVAVADGSVRRVGDTVTECSLPRHVIGFCIAFSVNGCHPGDGDVTDG